MGAVVPEALAAAERLDQAEGESRGRATPLVTVLDVDSNTLAFLATINRVPHATLGVAQFGQSRVDRGPLPLQRHR
jgi:hypothetical protein